MRKVHELTSNHIDNNGIQISSYDAKIDSLKKWIIIIINGTRWKLQISHLNQFRFKDCDKQIETTTRVAATIGKLLNKKNEQFSNDRSKEYQQGTAKIICEKYIHEI